MGARLASLDLLRLPSPLPLQLESQGCLHMQNGRDTRSGKGRVDLSYLFRMGSHWLFGAVSADTGLPPSPVPGSHAPSCCFPPLAAARPATRALRALASPEGEWGSDGEGSPSEGPPAAKSSSHSSPRRRLRTAFSLEQISTLESAFQRHRYLGAAQRRKLAAKMRLSEVQIKTWFQNRRMKLKRQMQEMRSEVYPSIPFYSPLPFGSQNGPLSYVYSPHQQTVSKREDPMSLGLPFPPLPAPSIDPRSPSAGQPGAVWPMPLPCLVGYQDPRTVFMSL